MLTASEKNITFLAQKIYQLAIEGDQKRLEDLLPLDLISSVTPKLLATKRAIRLLAEQGEISAVNLLMNHVANRHFLFFSVGAIDAIEGYAFGGYENELNGILASLLAKEMTGELENETHFTRTLYSLATGFARRGCDYQVCISKPKELFRQQRNMSEREERSFELADIFLPHHTLKGYAQEGYYPDKIDEFINQNDYFALALFTIAGGYLEGEELSKANDLIQTAVSIASKKQLYGPTGMEVYTGLEYYYALAGHLDGPNLFRTLCLTQNNKFCRKLVDNAKEFNDNFDAETLLKEAERVNRKLNELIKVHKLSSQQAETYFSVMSELTADNLVRAFVWEREGTQLVEQGIPEEIKAHILSFVIGRSEKITHNFFTIAKQKIGFFVEKIAGVSIEETEQKDPIVNSQLHF